MRSSVNMAQRLVLLLLALLALLSLVSCQEEPSPEDSGEYTEGLTFALNEDETAYTVTGMGTATATNVVIPSVYQGLPVEAIGDSAFAAQIELIDVELPTSIKTIGNRAFRDCINLKMMTFQRGSELTQIGYAAFKGCKALTGIQLYDDSKITSIGESAFSGCTKMMGFSIPPLVTKIEPYTFKGCSGLIRITIPKGIACIDEYAFENCTELQDVIFDNFSALTTIGIYSFSGCEKLTNIDLPSSLATIGASAFRKCSSLPDITIPAATTSIGSYAFSYCRKLTSLQVDDGNTVFYDEGNCIIERATQTVVVGCKASSIPSDGSVKIIGACAFAGCQTLTKLKIPVGVETIQGYAFYDCTKLRTIDLPASVTKVEAGAFGSCDATVSVFYHGDSGNRWQAIVIETGNEGLTRLGETADETVNWYSYSEIDPGVKGQYWRYVNGSPKIWN